MYLPQTAFHNASTKLGVTVTQHATSILSLCCKTPAIVKTSLFYIQQTSAKSADLPLRGLNCRQKFHESDHLWITNATLVGL
jgi:hypothetical protein